MNDLDEYKVVSDQSVVNNEPRYKNCALCFANTIAVAMTSEQCAAEQNGAQCVSIWGQNELLEGLWMCFWDQRPGWMWPKWSQGRLPQFRPSILGFFWSPFWKIFEIHTALKDEVCFRCAFGSEIWSKFNEFGFQIRTKWRWDLTISSDMRKVDFWTTVRVFLMIFVVVKQLM